MSESMLVSSQTVCRLIMVSMCACSNTSSRENIEYYSEGRDLIMYRPTCQAEDSSVMN